MGAKSFNPFFVRTHLRSIFGELQADVGERFQSLLRQDSSSIEARSRRLHRRTRVSIPSSSGLIFDLKDRESTPLFPSLVSIPSSSGLIFDLTRELAEVEVWYGFQSLLRQDSSSIQEREEGEWVAMIQVSIPSSSGLIFDPSLRAWHRRLIPSVSIPSSSGLIFDRVWRDSSLSPG